MNSRHLNDNLAFRLKSFALSTGCVGCRKMVELLFVYHTTAPDTTERDTQCINGVQDFKTLNVVKLAKLL